MCVSTHIAFDLGLLHHGFWKNVAAWHNCHTCQQLHQYWRLKFYLLYTAISILFAVQFSQGHLSSFGQRNDSKQYLFSSNNIKHQRLNVKRWIMDICCEHRFVSSSVPTYQSGQTHIRCRLDIDPTRKCRIDIWSTSVGGRLLSGTIYDFALSIDRDFYILYMLS